MFDLLENTTFTSCWNLNATVNGPSLENTPFTLHGECRNLDISVDIETIILRSKDDRSVLHQRNVKTLSMLNLALKRTEQLPSLTEHGEVEVVVVVGNRNLARGGQTNTNGEVRDPFSSYLPQVISLVVENLNAMGPVVTDKNLHLIVDNYPIGKLEISRAAELVEDITHHVKNDNPHDFTFDNNYPPPAVSSNPSGMLKNVGPKLPYEVAELVKDLNLMCWGSLRHNYVPRRCNHGNSIWIKQLTIPFANFTELEFEVAFFVKYLDPVIISIRHNNLIILGNRNTTWLGKLTLKDPKLSELAVINHFLTPYLRLWWVNYGSRWHWSCQGCNRA